MSAVARKGAVKLVLSQPKKRKGLVFYKTKSLLPKRSIMKQAMNGSTASGTAAGGRKRARESSGEDKAMESGGDAGDDDGDSGDGGDGGDGGTRGGNGGDDGGEASGGSVATTGGGDDSGGARKKRRRAKGCKPCMTGNQRDAAQRAAGGPV